MNRVYIIAEAGVNHNGSIELAKKLIDVAADSGADAVKFQTFKADKLVSKNADKAEYQKQTTDVGESQYDMIKKLELDYDVHKELIEYSNSKNIEFLSTPFDLESVDLLDSLGLETFKIPSGEITNKPYLEKIGSLKKSIILSTGMSNLGEVEQALGVLNEAGTPNSNISVLHANTEYPTPMCDVNLNAMKTIGNAFNLKVGYSDHTRGIEIPIAAAALGAKVIEKHFTLDRKMEGPDHKASLEPNELKQMIISIRNVETAMGDGIKAPSTSEEKNIAIARKSIHIKTDIKVGDVITLESLVVLRPGNGISPMLIDSIIGRVAKRNLSAGKILNWEDF